MTAAAATRAMVPAVKLVTPLKQGSCDNLCGLYAILNALALTLTARSVVGKDELQQWFDLGIAWLDGHGALVSSMRDGIAVPVWHDVAHALCTTVGAAIGTALRLERPFARRRLSRAAAFAHIESLVRARQVPLISIEGAYSHYSVICGYSPAILRLFDSNGLLRIRRDACGVGADRRRRHRLDLRAMMVIAATD